MASAYEIDLHNHMPLFAGDYRGPMDTTGDDVVAAAREAGVHVLAVTDHFSIDFYEHVAAAAADVDDLLVLPGAEIRLAWEGDEVHLVALFPPDSAERRFAALMQVLGFEPMGRSALQSVVIEHDPVDAAHAISALGGICTVAHVDRTFGDYRLLGRPALTRLLDTAPIAAVEFIDATRAHELGELRRGRSCIQSSDSHHAREIGRRRSVVELGELSFAGLRDALMSGCVLAPAAV
ncbi:MAG: hypothetical protein Q7W30_06850 [Coriobacteriia bacterium]|nr:hypothetical protein [Coriobacteriia bacterium]